MYLNIFLSFLTGPHRAGEVKGLTETVIDLKEPSQWKIGKTSTPINGSLIYHSRKSKLAWCPVFHATELEEGATELKVCLDCLWALHQKRSRNRRKLPAELLCNPLYRCFSIRQLNRTAWAPASGKRKRQEFIDHTSLVIKMPTAAQI